MDSRERIKHTLGFKIPDCVGIYDCLWDETVTKWQHENKLPQGQPYQDYFNFDMRLFDFDHSFLLEERKIGEDSNFQTVIDSFGVTERRWKNKRGASLILDTTIKDKASWVSFKDLLQPIEARINNFPDFKQNYENAYAGGRFTVFSFLGPFQHSVKIFGLQKALETIKKHPQLIGDVFLTSAQFTINMCEFLRQKGFIFDGAWFWEDLAYKNSTFFSPDIYRQLLYDVHKRMCHYFQSRRMPIIFHSDGNLVPILPHLLNAGIRAVTPLEIDCGFDLERLKKEYRGQLVIFGNMPTKVLETNNKAEIEDKLKRRIEIAKKDGGFIYHSDKPVPPSVEFENYEFALGIVKKYGQY